MKGNGNLCVKSVVVVGVVLLVQFVLAGIPFSKNPKADIVRHVFDAFRRTGVNLARAAIDQVASAAFRGPRQVHLHCSAVQHRQRGLGL